MKFLLLLLAFLNFRCTSTSKMSASIDIKDVNFIIAPHIVKKNGDYFLVYQIAKKEDEANVRLQVGEKIINQKFYYFFIGKISFPEYDHEVMRAIKKGKNVRNIFENGAVFWLNPDKSEVKLSIRGE